MKASFFNGFFNEVVIILSFQMILFFLLSGNNSLRLSGGRLLRRLGLGKWTFLASSASFSRNKSSPGIDNQSTV
jgi:hypothetical protein